MAAFLIGFGMTWGFAKAVSRIGTDVTHLLVWKGVAIFLVTSGKECLNQQFAMVTDTGQHLEEGTRTQRSKVV